LASDEWKYDVIPEILNGHNVADFIDPEIEAKLDALEHEEDEREKTGIYDEDADEPDEEMVAIRDLAKRVLEKRKLAIQTQRANRGKNRPSIPLKAKAKVYSIFFFNNIFSVLY
jgi:nucleolar GTP-binding protein